MSSRPATATTAPDSTAQSPDLPVQPRHGGVPPIHFTNLTKRFGAVTAVDDVSFQVQPGRVTGFLGPNGAGKTTTLRMLVGLATPTEGAATFGGIPYVDLEDPQQEVGTVLEANFHPGRSGRNHLRVLAATAEVDDDRVDQLLELVGLADAAHRKAGDYSLGMRQRLGLAGALLGDPDYLILDEPANGLDPEGIRWLRTFLKSYAAQQRVVLISSHLLTEVQATVDDIVVIGHGRLLHKSKMSDLEAATMSRVRVPDRQAAAAALTGVGLEVEEVTDDEGDFLRVLTHDTQRVGELLFAAGVAVYELTRERSDLEASFFKLVEEAA